MGQVNTLKLDATIQNLKPFRSFVRETLANTRDSRLIDDMVLTADELITNVVRHGYQGQAGTIQLTIHQDDSRVEMTISDQAPPFDPTIAPEADPSLTLDERPLGKMGIYFVRQLVDEFSYTRTENDSNEVKFVKYRG